MPLNIAFDDLYVEFAIVVITMCSALHCNVNVTIKQSINIFSFGYLNWLVLIIVCWLTKCGFNIWPKNVVNFMKVMQNSRTIVKQQMKKSKFQNIFKIFENFKYILFWKCNFFEIHSLFLFFCNFDFFENVNFSLNFDFVLKIVDLFQFTFFLLKKTFLKI